MTCQVDSFSCECSSIYSFKGCSLLFLGLHIGVPNFRKAKTMRNQTHPNRTVSGTATCKFMTSLVYICVSLPPSSVVIKCIIMQTVYTRHFLSPDHAWIWGYETGWSPIFSCLLLAHPDLIIHNWPRGTHVQLCCCLSISPCWGNIHRHLFKWNHLFVYIQKVYV